MFRYRLHSADGDDLGESTYAVPIKPGDEIHVGAEKRFRVLDVVPFEEEDESPFMGSYRLWPPSQRRGRRGRASFAAMSRMTSPALRGSNLRTSPPYKAVTIMGVVSESSPGVASNFAGGAGTKSASRTSSGPRSSRWVMC